MKIVGTPDSAFTEVSKFDFGTVVVRETDASETPCMVCRNVTSMQHSRDLHNVFLTNLDTGEVIEIMASAKVRKINAKLVLGN